MVYHLSPKRVLTLLAMYYCIFHSMVFFFFFYSYPVPKSVWGHDNVEGSTAAR
jgi:hypothetical protein